MLCHQKLKISRVTIRKIQIYVAFWFFLVACKQQTQPDLSAQVTLIPTAVALTETERDASAVIPFDASSSATPTANVVLSPGLESGSGDWGILFLEDSNPAHVYAIKPDGSELVMLATFDYAPFLLDTSPDGLWLLLASEVQGTYALKLDSSNEQVLLSERMAAAGLWSPDGRHVLLLYGDALIMADVPSSQAIEITLPLLPEFPDSYFQPQAGYVEGASWSPDGSWFVFQHAGLTDDGQWLAGLFRYTVATGVLDELYRDTHYRYRARHYETYRLRGYPVISPDGQTIFTDLGTHHGLAVLPANGGPPTLLRDMHLPLVEPPNLSPDGQWLAVVYQGDIYLLRADGIGV